MCVTEAVGTSPAPWAALANGQHHHHVDPASSRGGRLPPYATSSAETIWHRRPVDLGPRGPWPVDQLTVTGPVDTARPGPVRLLRRVIGDVLSGLLVPVAAAAASAAAGGRCRPTATAVVSLLAAILMQCRLSVDWTTVTAFIFDKYGDDGRRAALFDQ